MASLFRGTSKYLQRQAHENPVLFYSCIIGAVGPVLALVVPPVRAHFGYVPPPPLPMGYPVPNRARRAVTGYEDE
ncbi:hypothetical protein D9611_001528 [Ephemerocybe angulata]|uniref:Uncharacterized protein n=2 Tax=Ephemerocybe angulata TaxID=980116 RepID=A0A8H6I250_9AGAR|nr:hypothetical protein D9611_001528 [Tulosesus angulatus]KAF6757284.1 hypothetical protein DFP72DRAFT_1066130 [Tulosesus angulatus]